MAAQTPTTSSWLPWIAVPLVAGLFGTGASLAVQLILDDDEEEEVRKCDGPVEEETDWDDDEEVEWGDEEEPKAAILRVEANPNNAAIYVDSLRIDDSPVEVELEPREYKISVRAKGYTSYSEMLAAREGEEIDLQVDLRRLKANAVDVDTEVGKVSVSAKPNGEVKIDGKLVGSTPLLDYDVEPGLHVVEISFPEFGGQSKRKALAVRRGQTARVFFTP